jgi:hypothetical protein
MTVGGRDLRSSVITNVTTCHLVLLLLGLPTSTIRISTQKVFVVGRGGLGTIQPHAIVWLWLGLFQRVFPDC